MPWKETHAMEQRVQFIGDWLSGRYTKTELCGYYGISRPTGDKWIQRYQALGLDGLNALPKAAKHHPNATAPALCERIVRYKLRHQRFGPKKVMDGLRGKTPPWPGRPTARPVRSRSGPGWWAHAGGAAGYRRTVSRWPTATVPMRCGAPTSKAISPGATAAAVTPRPSPTTSAVTCSAGAWNGPPRNRSGPGSNGCSTNTACPWPFAPTTARPSPRWRWVG